MIEQTVIQGPPGTGKTRYLLDQVSAQLASDTPPEKIGFVAFTTRAANEAKDRALAQFDVMLSELVNFRTIHSMCFRLVGLRKSQVMQEENYNELGESLGLELSGKVDIAEGIYGGMTKDDRLLFLENLARIQGETLRSLWEELYYEDIDWFELERVREGLRQYKESNALVDFTDMLNRFLEEPITPELELLCVDEAQDLSPLQWRVINALKKNATRCVVAGDDDQAIYRWAGASAQEFIVLAGTRQTLSQSYRLPAAIKSITDTILDNITNRRSKHFNPRTGDNGQIYYETDIDNIDLSEGSWLLLARHAYQLRNYESHCEREGFPYTSRYRSPYKSPVIDAIRSWETLRGGSKVPFPKCELITRYIRSFKMPTIDPNKSYTAEDLGLDGDLPIWHEAFDNMQAREREYFIACLRRGETLVKVPRIRISTIHGAKGAEADHVVVMTDVSRRVYDSMLRDPDDELRVFYVAFTRARHSLFILEPHTNMAFEV